VFDGLREQSGGLVVGVGQKKDLKGERGKEEKRSWLHRESSPTA
jgi:hypothetical protein